MGGLSNKVVGMILAGGRGSKMGLLCQDRASYRRCLSAEAAG